MASAKSTSMIPNRARQRDDSLGRATGRTSRSDHAFRAAALVVLFATVLGLVPMGAWADGERVPFLAEKIKAEDFRVRTGAALALGSTNAQAAVGILCIALTDPNEVVRQAAAAALGRLARASALGCLRARQKVEPNASVRAQVARAIESTEARANEVWEGVVENPGARYYVAVASVGDPSGGAPSEVQSVVAHALRRGLEAAGTIQIAPTQQTPDEVKETLARRKLKGFYLVVSIDPFEYSGGNLRVKLRVNVFSYPGKALLGTIDKSLTKQGVEASDRDSENQLLELSAGRVCEEFATSAGSFL